MRTAAIPAWLCIFTICLTGLADQGSQPAKRYGVDYDARKYPQSNPKEALGSVLKALGEKQYDYLLAYLADPAFVDARVTQLGGSAGSDASPAQKQASGFDRLVKETADSFLSDPSKMTDLQRFFKDGEWEEGTEQASARVRNLQARKVFMKKTGPERWALMDKEK